MKTASLKLERAVGELVQVAFNAYHGKGNSRPVILRPKENETRKVIRNRRRRNPLSAKGENS